MKKISKILESVSLGNLVLSDSEFNDYKRYLNKRLLDLYPDHVDISGSKFVKAQRWETPNRFKSILNYVNTNIMLNSWIVRTFKIESFSGLIQFVHLNTNELFLQDGEYFDQVIKILKTTEEIGMRNEINACKILKNVIFEKLGKNVEVIRTETDSSDDIFDGIDIYFILDDKKWTCQVKPLKDISFIGDKVKVKSSGRIKKYSTHYWMFIDSQNKFALFKNKNPIINGFDLEFNIENLVSNS
jgi:hypothetical protein